MSKHTPGPWVPWQLANDPREYGMNAGKFIIVTGDHENEISGVVHAEADARLIAAAPTMLEVLQDALDWTDMDIKGFDDIAPNMEMLEARRDVLKAALAQAEGG